MTLEDRSECCLFDCIDTILIRIIRNGIPTMLLLHLIVISVAFVMRAAQMDSLPAIRHPYDIASLPFCIHLDLRGVVAAAPNTDAPADTLPPVENSDIDFPLLIIWTIVHQADAFHHSPQSIPSPHSNILSIQGSWHRQPQR